MNNKPTSFNINICVSDGVDLKDFKTYECLPYFVSEAIVVLICLLVRGPSCVYGLARKASVRCQCRPTLQRHTENTGRMFVAEYHENSSYFIFVYRPIQIISTSHIRLYNVE